MSKCSIILTLSLLLASTGFAEINRYLQTGYIQRRVSDATSKQYDVQYEGATYTFIGLRKDEVTVIIELQPPYSSKLERVYIKISESGNDIILKQKGELLSSQTIFINTKLMEFVDFSGSYVFDEYFSGSICYGKLTPKW